MMMETHSLLAESMGDSVWLVVGLVLFLAAGAGMVLGALVFGRFVRPKVPHPEKLAAYECGEPAIGSGWVQFDLRFYVVALVFVIFDIEIALLFPWAVVYGGGAHPGAPAEVLRQVRESALIDMLFFFGVLVVGFLYLWRFGYLDWVRSSENAPGVTWSAPPPPRESTEGLRT
jgi:NADH-quinone oxidoreductase subunit A